MNLFRAGIATGLSLALSGAALAADPTPAADSDLKTGPATISAHWSKYKYPDSVPEGTAYYIIVKGDTLWDLSKRFLQSPFLWPQIWDQNRYISDAHWIYPGDPLIIPRVNVIADKAGQAGATGQAEAEEFAPAPPPADVLVPATEEMTLRCAPVIAAAKEDESFQMIGSEQGASKTMFGDYDILYLNRGSNAGVKPGDVYTLHHSSYKVRNPETGKVVGQKIETTGWVRVLLVQENSATAIVERACRDIMAGNYLKPWESVNVPLLLRRPPADRLTAPSGKAQGLVIDTADDTAQVATGQLLAISLGSADGISPGAVLSVYRTMYPSVPTSRNVVGEIAVVSAKEKTAWAKVTYSTDGIMHGDHVEVR